MKTVELVEIEQEPTFADEPYPQLDDDDTDMDSLEYATETVFPIKEYENL